MEAHLVDGTFELFRYFYAVPSHRADVGEVGAVRAVARSLAGMLEDGATHVGVATDHVIESFRNNLWPGYKTGAGIDPDLWSQFPLLEDTLRACGFTVWPMDEWEADDALASAAGRAEADPRFRRILVCSPDKDLAQCVRGDRVVQFDRRGAGRIRDEAAVEEAYGVPPWLVPDWLALMGDTADGFPGLPGFGAKSAAAVARAFGGVEGIPVDAGGWSAVTVRGAAKLANTFAAHREAALLFRRLATLRTDAPVGEPDDWRWTGPQADAEAACAAVDAPELAGRLHRIAAGRGA